MRKYETIRNPRNEIKPQPDLKTTFPAVPENLSKVLQCQKLLNNKVLYRVKIFFIQIYNKVADLLNYK